MNSQDSEGYYYYENVPVEIAKEDLAEILNLKAEVRELRMKFNHSINMTIYKALKILGDNAGYYAAKLTDSLDHPAFAHLFSTPSLYDEEDPDIEE